MAEFKDPLEEMINRQKEALGKKDEAIEVDDTDIIGIDEIEDDDEVVNVDDFDDDIYGVHDAEREIEQEEAAEEERKQKMLEEMHADDKPKTMMPPDEHDMAYHTEAIQFQADKLEIVTNMVKQVVEKHNIREGGIPEVNDIRFRVMGELVSMYEADGEVITPGFEEMILNNWYFEDGTTAMDRINGKATEEKKPEVEEKKEEIKPTNIIIDAREDTPVTVNIDSEELKHVTNTREFRIKINRVNDINVKASRIIENPQRNDVITTYDSGINDVPITLPMSAYRCVVRPITYLEFLSLAIPNSNNRSDREMIEWTMLYKHTKNVSIGAFETFEDFLKCTKYQDKELMMWALLVATADDEETIPVTCGNQDCKESYTMKYNARSLIHVNENHMPDHYQKTHDVAAGAEAKKHFEMISSTVKRYEFPESKYMIDICEPSAYDYINNVLPEVTKLVERFDIANREFTPDDPLYAEFDILMSLIMYTRRIVKIEGENEIRYTKFEDMERIMRESLSPNDSAVLISLINTFTADRTPIEFYLDNVNCPKCGRHDDRVPIDDIGARMLFPVSRRFQSTTISLIDQLQK